MRLFKEESIHSFEAGRRGKPDELDSIIADLVGKYFLEINSNARFDLRVGGSFQEDKPHIRLSGEVSSALLKHNYQDELSNRILGLYNQIHRTNLQSKELDILFQFKPQSHDLAVNTENGDSGSPIAVAYRNSPNYLPFERYIAVELRDLVDTIFQDNGRVPIFLAKESGITEIRGLKADGKIGLSATYDGANILKLGRIVAAVEHEKNLSVTELREKINGVFVAYLTNLKQRYGFEFDKDLMTINGREDWNSGGWKTDEGSREAKPHRAFFSSYGVNEDSPIGEDPSKISQTGTMLARYIANQIVANGFAEFAKVSMTYVIGSSYPEELVIETNRTSPYPQKALHDMISNNVPLKLNEVIDKFGLKDPKIRQKLINGSDYFHDQNLPWNQIQRLDYENLKPYLTLTDRLLAPVKRIFI